MSQQKHDPLTEFSSVISNLIDVTDNIARVEEAKTSAASARRHELLDGCIQEEQALILKLRGFEQHRIQLQKSFGWDGFTLSQILEKASEEQRQVLAPLFHDLERQLKRLKRAREASEQIIGVRLHELQTIASRLEGTSYNSDGSAAAPMPRSGLRDTYV